MAEIRVNRAKRKLQEGKPVIAIQSDSPDEIDLIGSSGTVDVLWSDMELGPVTWSKLGDFSRACDIWGVTSVVKVNANEPGLIGRALNLGVQGVAVPHVNTKEEAERAVRAAKYAPLGTRAMGRPRQGYGVPDYFSKANDETMVVVVIEDIEAVKNLKEILTVDHIDVFLVAPHDLSQSMGPKYLSETWGQFHPDVMRVYEQAVRQIVAAGRVAGLGDTGDSSIEQKMEWGGLYISTSRRPYAASGGQQFYDKVAALAKGRSKQQAPTRKRAR